MPLAANIADALMNDLAGDDFSIGEILWLEDENDDDICTEEGIHNMGGTQLCEPTVQPAEFVEGQYGAILFFYKLTFNCHPFISQCKQSILNRSGKPIKMLMVI